MVGTETHQMCSESELPSDNVLAHTIFITTELSRLPKPSTKQEVHGESLYSRVSKKKLFELERYGNLWNKILEVIDRKNMLVQRLEENS